MNDTQPIISTTVHGFGAVRPRFAFRGDRLHFDWVHQLKTRRFTARNDTLRRELLAGTGEILRLVRQANFKSP